MSRNGPSAWRSDDRDGGSSRYRPPSPGYDSWRPRDERRDRAPRHQGYDSYRAPDPYRASDSYRAHDPYRAPDRAQPYPPQGDFTFRVEKPSGIEPISFTPINQPVFRRERRGHNHARGRNSNRPRWQPPPHPSERALISGQTYGLPEERLHDAAGVAKFRNLDELSDDDEVDMEISSQSSEPEPENPVRKRARTRVNSDSADAVPKWSNPDPYTALPCPDETTRKKKDMVKLIRKARVEETKPNTDAPPEAEDFISFDLTSDEDDDAPQPSQPLQPSTGFPPRPPSRPRADRPPVDTPKAPAAASTSNNDRVAQDRSGPLGSRKRTADDVVKPPDYGQLKKFSMKPSKGLLVPNWQPKKNEEPCPWSTADHSAELNMSVRLHKEIVDFYEFVRPKDFEQRIRDNLVENLKKAMKRDGRNFASAQVHPFGSFMSGLYLPTADMDLVVCSASFMKGGPPTYLGAKSWLYKFQKFLIAQGVADGDSIEVIAHARIPLVKFVDRLTGLKVDVSFENLGGVGAVDTFLAWKAQYPVMPILVTVIKHFLLMRGLNEPVNGGIGGFSVICLVVSMLQVMPQVQSRSMQPKHHLGELLLDFFELYGRHFQYQTNAISLTRPVGYIRKSEVDTFGYKNMGRLSIIDPNNPSNDIAGGSSNTPAILARFHDAYLTLRDRMNEVARHPDKGGILDEILKGDYSSFRMQRAYLKHVHEQNLGPCSD
ncbi:Non-canonical poly(A) RNA polymerase PAPD5 [Tolypocladium paradoxum]|uniref:polynucleotide adenylyltransferase n=1 Tax=Tolypocladium paradoxum TaxID=94208 RepID=A0A2S4KX67_9HYPO|nr:Non-canonical poly(A) RNA polymerase PAPD5 [Tolypocladium paradoxum]